MKRLILQGALSVAALMAVAAPPPAFADVTVTATIDKTKDITVHETITVIKTVEVTATVSLRAVKAAEGDTIVNQTNVNNFACGNCAEKLDWIKDSVNSNTGAISINQAAGNMNNQANAVTAVVDAEVGGDAEVPPGTEPPATPGGFAQAQASVDQRMGATKRNTATVGEPVWIEVPDPNFINTVNVLFRDADIDGSINHNVGVVQANQSAGNINNQTNTLTLALSLSGGVALSEGDLGQVNANDSVHEASVIKRAEISDSISDNHGIVGVNSTSGNLANQANVVALAAAIQVVP